MNLCVECGKAPVRPKTSVYGAQPKRCLDCQREFMHASGRRAQRKHRLLPEVRDRERAYARAVQATAEGRQRNTDYKREWTQRQREAGIHTTALLSQAEFEELLRAQRGVCAICRKPETKRSAMGRVRRLSIDHDHTTGRVRALLCSRCNTALGNLRDDPDLADRAAEYLRWERMRTAAAVLNEALGGEPPLLVRPLRRHRAAEKMQEALG